MLAQGRQVAQNERFEGGCNLLEQVITMRKRRDELQRLAQVRLVMLGDGNRQAVARRQIWESNLAC
jgi:hypothetical protein